MSLVETNGGQALEAVRGFGTKPVTMNYLWKGGNEIDWLTFPEFDLYYLARRVQAAATFRPSNAPSHGPRSAGHSPSTFWMARRCSAQRRRTSSKWLLVQGLPGSGNQLSA